VNALPIPEQMQLFKNNGFCYNDSESQNIWLTVSVSDAGLSRLCAPGLE